MDESILNDIKKLIGLAPEDTSFDTDLLIHINSAIAVLTQLGVKPNLSFTLIDEGSTWSEYLSQTYLDGDVFRIIKSYIAMKVRLIFDPPQNSTVMEALKSSIAEYEWRLNVFVDPFEEENS